jgi:hypothetical protein
MKKMFATILMATTALLFQTVEASDPRYGYFYLNETVSLPSSVDTPPNNDPTVDWDGAINGIQGIHSEGVYVNPDNTTTLVIKHPGTYLVTYSLTVEQDETYITEPGDAQFGLFLNGYLVPGSVYGTGNAFSEDFISSVFNGAMGTTGGDFTAETQVNGQALVVVSDHNSYLSLQNYGENDVILSADAGTEDINFGSNVSASILINRIDKHHDEYNQSQSHY